MDLSLVQQPNDNIDEKRPPTVESLRVPPFLFVFISFALSSPRLRFIVLVRGLSSNLICIWTVHAKPARPTAQRPRNLATRSRHLVRPRLHLAPQQHGLLEEHQVVRAGRKVVGLEGGERCLRDEAAIVDGPRQESP